MQSIVELRLGGDIDKGKIRIVGGKSGRLKGLLEDHRLGFNGATGIRKEYAIELSAGKIVLKIVEILSRILHALENLRLTQDKERRGIARERISVGLMLKKVNCSDTPSRVKG